MNRRRIKPLNESLTIERWELLVDFTEIEDSGVPLQELQQILALERRSSTTYRKR